MDNSNWYGLGIAALALLFIFFVKTPDKALEIENLMLTTMGIHDEAMRELASMNRVGRLLKTELNGLDSLSARADSIRLAIHQMQKAEEDMYTWMRNYKAPTTLPVEEAKVYLKDQKEKIDANNRDIKEALVAGNRLLGKE